MSTTGKASRGECSLEAALCECGDPVPMCPNWMPSRPSPAFAPGTVVRLKSGGPAMTVSTPTRTDGVVSVEWFNGAALCRDGFDACCLVAAIEGETQQLTPSALNELARKLMVETIELRRKLPPHT